MDLKPSERLQQSILGCLLHFPEERTTADNLLKPEDFIIPKYRDVYSYLQQNKEADGVILSAAMPNIPFSELSQWMDSEFTAAYLPGYCRDLKELSRKIRLWQALTDIRNQSADLTTAEMIDHTEKALLDLSLAADSPMKTVNELAADAYKRMEYRYKNRGQIQGATWGFPELDKLTGGAHPGDMIVVAGRPSMGKSAFAMNVAENMAASGRSVAVFSLEMSDIQLMDRMVASHSRVSLGRIRNGNFKDGDWSRMTSGFDQIHKLKIHVDDTPGIGLHEIKSKTRRLKIRGELDAVVVDYLTLLKTEDSRGDSRSRAVGALSRGIKQLARELNVPVIALCQLSRNGVGRKPVMSDLRDSGEIEQDADVILFPYRESAECEKCRDKIEKDGHSTRLHESQAELIIEKQRNGPRNVSIKMVWIGEHQRFEEGE